MNSAGRRFGPEKALSLVPKVGFSSQENCGSNGSPSSFFGNQWYVTKDQLAEALSLSVSYINKLMAEEGLPHLKIGRAVRFQVKEVVAWLQKRSRP